MTTLTVMVVAEVVVGGSGAGGGDGDGGEALALEEMGWKPATQGKGWREGP